MLDFDGKVAIVTGGGGAIGSAVVHTLARLHAKVLVVDIDGQRAAACADAVAQQGGRAISHRADVSIEAEAAGTIAAAIAAFRGVDVLVNLAAALSLNRRDGTVESMDAALWDQAMAGTLRSAMLCCKHAIPEISRRGGGAIVNISSGASLYGMLGLSAYSAAKSGINAMTRSIATQTGRQNIRCNAICPGLIIGDPAKRPNPDPVLAFDDASRLVPEVGLPQDIANVAVFLASDAARYLTGQVITVDGGLSCHTPSYSDMLRGGAKVTYGAHHAENHDETDINP
jgi:NAD(P)-dependent dehydrogenase (short-subunit alcohol dehydrogenase family)